MKWIIKKTIERIKSQNAKQNRKMLAKFTRKIKKNTQITEIKKGVITTALTEIKMIRKYEV